MSRVSLFILVGAIAVAACHTRSAELGNAPGDPPSFVIGDFDDDYGGRHTVSAREWVQGRDRYHIVRWNSSAQYLVARNDSSNHSAPGKWTRIDWMPFTGMPPYEWGFCLSAYEAASMSAAEVTTIANRASPRTGCNGFPFSRMRRRGTPGTNQ